MTLAQRRQLCLHGQPGPGRKGQGKNGRTDKIMVPASDLASNMSKCMIGVIAPHDQGKKSCRGAARGGDARHDLGVRAGVFRPRLQEQTAEGRGSSNHCGRRLAIPQELFPSMPGEMDLIGKKRRVARQSNPLPMVVAQRFLIGAKFTEAVVSDQDGKVIRERPEAVIKQPVGVFTKGNAVSDVIIP